MANLPPLQPEQRVAALAAITAAAANHDHAGIRPASWPANKTTPGITIIPTTRGTAITLDTLTAKLDEARQTWPLAPKLQIFGAKAATPQTAALETGGDTIFEEPTVYGEFDAAGINPGAAPEIPPNLPIDPSSLYAPEDGIADT